MSRASSSHSGSVIPAAGSSRAENGAQGRARAQSDAPFVGIGQCVRPAVRDLLQPDVFKRLARCISRRGPARVAVSARHFDIFKNSQTAK